MHRYIIPVTSSVVIALMMLAFLHDTAKKNAIKQISTKELNVGEVDVSRWAHDGEQPTYWKSGNGMKVEEPIVKELLRNYF